MEESTISLFSLAFTLFLLMDPIGNIPLYISLLKEIEPKRQRIVIFREMMIALGIIILFNFVGEALLNFLNITKDTVEIAGGVILFLLSLKLIFPDPTKEGTQEKTHGEPFIVPLAVPLVAGPSVLAMVMLLAQQHSALFMIGSITCAWAVALLILLSAPSLRIWLGQRGIIACERLMGLILTFLAIQMLLNGISHFFKLAPAAGGFLLAL